MIKSGALKAFLSADKGTRVIGQVDRYLMARPKDDRNMLVIHPSAMASKTWCHREQYFLLMGFEPKNEHHGLAKRLVFDTGHAAHSRWQEWFGEMDKIKGIWKCTDCKFEWTGIRSEHEAGHEVAYHEVPVRSEMHRIAGKADGWLVGFGGDLLLEIKTLGEGSFRWYAPDLLAKANGDHREAWKNLEAPFIEHVLQAQIYLKLLEIMEVPDAPQEIVFIYEAKWSHEVKEFFVQKSDFGVTELFDQALEILKAVDAKIPPMCNIGGSAGCKKCDHYQEELLRERIID
jgi:hypothetical protein